MNYWILRLSKNVGSSFDFFGSQVSLTACNFGTVGLIGSGLGLFSSPSHACSFGIWYNLVVITVWPDTRLTKIESLVF